MRSSKSRSRNKQNRNNNNRSVGNIINRVFDSSGPEGKVRGTPQQIIEKYTQLARDAQLSNDRVAAENFQQHAEHYTRMLGEAMREMEAQRIQNESRQPNDNRGGRDQDDDGAENGRQDNRQETARQDNGRQESGRQDNGRQDNGRHENNNRGDEERVKTPYYGKSNRSGDSQPEATDDAFAVAAPDISDDEGAALVETPEAAASAKPKAEKRPRAPRKPKAEPAPQEEATTD